MKNTAKRESERNSEEEEERNKNENVRKIVQTGTVRAQMGTRTLNEWRIHIVA